MFVPSFNQRIVVFVLAISIRLAGASGQESSRTISGLTFVSHTNLSFGIVDGDFVYDLSKTSCSIKCLSMGNCVGFKCYARTKDSMEESGGDKFCEHCALTTNSSTHNISHPPLANELMMTSMYWGAYTHALSKRPEVHASHRYYVPFPGGFHANMILNLQGVWDDQEIYVQICQDLDEPPSPRPDSDLYLRAYADPDVLFVTYFSGEGSNNWPYPVVSFQRDDFVKVGEFTDWVIFISQLEYVIYIDGKHLVSYTHSRRYSLETFKYLALTPCFSVVRWYDRQ